MAPGAGKFNTPCGMIVWAYPGGTTLVAKNANAMNADKNRSKGVTCFFLARMITSESSDYNSFTTKQCKLIAQTISDSSVARRSILKNGAVLTAVYDILKEVCHIF